MNNVETVGFVESNLTVDLESEDIHHQANMGETCLLLKSWVIIYTSFVYQLADMASSLRHDRSLIQSNGAFDSWWRSRFDHGNRSLPGTKQQHQRVPKQHALEFYYFLSWYSELSTKSARCQHLSKPNGVFFFLFVRSLPSLFEEKIANRKEPVDKSPGWRKWSALH